MWSRGQSEHEANTKRTAQKDPDFDVLERHAVGEMSCPALRGAL